MANSNLSSKDIKSLMNLYAAELRKLQFQSRLTRNTIADLKSDLAEVSAREAEEEKAKLETLTNAAEAPAKRGRKTTRSKTKSKTKRRGRPRTSDTSSTEEAATATDTAAETAPTTKKRGRGRPKGSGAKKTSTKKTAAKSTSTKSASTSKKASAKKGRKGGAYRPSEYDLLIMDALDNTGNAMIASEMQTYIENKFQEEGRNTSTNEIKTMITRSLQKLANRRSDLIKVRYEGRGFAYAQPKWVNPEGNLKKKYQR